jgi:hypothetical protein
VSKDGCIGGVEVVVSMAGLSAGEGNLHLAGRANF